MVPAHLVFVRRVAVLPCISRLDETVLARQTDRPILVLDLRFCHVVLARGMHLADNAGCQSGVLLASYPSLGNAGRGTCLFFNVSDGGCWWETVCTNGSMVDLGGVRLDSRKYVEIFWK